MIIVRNTFVAKPGCASKLATQIKNAISVSGLSGRVMTDITGEFNTVILEHEGANLEEFEKSMRQYETDPKLRDAMKGYTDLYLTGRREIYRVL